ncbi:Pentatricopeptide repeat-containing protein At5g11310, mitochondrial [Linum grandiflorum]
MKAVHFSLDLTKLFVKHRRYLHRLSSQSASVPGSPAVKRRQRPAPPPQSLPTPHRDHPNPNLEANYSHPDFSVLCSLLRDYSNLNPGPSLENALERTGIEPQPGLLEALFEKFDSSPKLQHALFLWAEKRPGFRCSEVLFNSMVNALGKARQFDAAWFLVLDRLAGDGDEDRCLVSSDTFAVLIRRYARAGIPEAAIRTYEYARNLDLVSKSDAGMRLFEILLDSLCKEEHVRVAAQYLQSRKKTEPSWIPSIRIYNILLNGWFRSRKLKNAERLWFEMKKEDVKPNVVTYGTLVEGYCRMRRAEIALDLLDEMRREGIQPNSIVYNPIIDALAEAGRFKEASGMMEHFLLCESGPNLSTYNSLVKGYCKAGDLAGASKILRTMIDRGFLPTCTTYNYFFRHFARFRKIEEAMNLYNKMIESGYAPDRLTYNLLLKMLCEEERLDLAGRISNEMEVRGCDADLASSTMLTHLLCKMHRFEEAFKEFEKMLSKGLVPQYLTFKRLDEELSKRGMVKMSRELRAMMSSVPHSTNLPENYDPEKDALRFKRRKSILQKAEAMSEMLKTCNDPRELVKVRGLSRRNNPVSSADRLILDIKERKTRGETL